MVVSQKEPLNVLLRYAIIPPSTLKFTATYFFQPFQKKEVLLSTSCVPEEAPEMRPWGKDAKDTKTKPSALGERPGHKRYFGG
ncbi:hypothetical protein CEXT_552851 [Caerostris extrusa]|uniref:Uncharacterized protein n=1 Tax=Caerostris extrusa TaxID=172846 RepID=A0AAV4Q8G6_CAEEX|nr:hypothetical protein CEXT_552851 [Caerostris extrusa]